MIPRSARNYLHRALQQLTDDAGVALQRTYISASERLKPPDRLFKKPPVSEPEAWRLPVYIACVLERLPVLNGPAPAWETEYRNHLAQRQLATGKLLDHPEVKHIYAPASEQNEDSKKQHGRASGAGAASVVPPEVSHVDLTQMYHVPMTSDDKDNNLKSMRRAMSDRLYLVVKGNAPAVSGLPTPWMFPTAMHQPGESIRKTCERALHNVIGRQYPVYFIGNAPMAHLPMKGKHGTLYLMSAQVVDDPWGPLSIQPSSGIQDYQWTTYQQTLEAVKAGQTDEESTNSLVNVLSKILGR